MGCITFLLISGFVNFFTLNAKYQFPPLYHPLFGIKVLLALAIFADRQHLVRPLEHGPARQAEPAPVAESEYLALAVLLVCISGVMRNITLNAPLKSATAKPPAAAAPAETTTEP